MLKKILLFLIIFALCLTGEIFAAPNISSVQGTVINKGTLTISGSNFGTGDTTPLLWDDFEDGALKNVLSSSPKIGTWQRNSSPYAVYSTTQKHSGNQSAYAWHDNSHQWSNFNVVNLPLADRFYQSFWFLYNASGNGQAKLCQVHGDSGKGDFAPGVMTGGFAADWWASYLSHSSDVLWTRENYPEFPSKNEWHFFEIILQRSSAGGVYDGTVIIKIDSQIMYNKKNIVTRMSSSYNWSLTEFFTGMTNFGTNTETYIDDCYLNNSWAKVELGNEPLYSDCKQREIQIPSAWSEDSITISVNQGSFTNGDTVYLFVLDADGIPSAGYGPITIGSGGEDADTTPPGDVTDLTRQVGDGLVVLEWTNPTDSDFEGTMIRYRTDGTYPTNNGDGIEVCNKVASPGTSDTYTITGLSNGTTYYFSAFTYDEDGNYSKAAHISATPSEADSDTTPPGDVSNFAAQTGDSQVVLNWTNPSDSDFKGTLIHYRTDGTYPANNSDGIEVCNKTTLPGASDTYTLTGLSNGTTYYFSAFTYDEDGNYSNAAHISAMPSANVYTKTFGDIPGSDFPGTCQDTYIKNDINYSDDSEAIRTYTWPTNSAANRIVMKWDLSILPQDTIIQEATLSLYMYDFEGTGGDDNYEITAHKIINHNPDISSCTWNTYDGTNSWTGGANGGEQDIASAESSTIVDKTLGYKNWDITQMVQEWVDNSSTNFGLMLNADTSAASDSNRYFRPTEYSNQDQRPILTIKYGSSDIPKVPSAPTGLGVSVSE